MRIRSIFKCSVSTLIDADFFLLSTEELNFNQSYVINKLFHLELNCPVIVVSKAQL